MATALATALHPDFGVLAGAVIAATLARDLVWIVQSRRVWWLIQATTDWAEVDRILREGGHG